MAKKKKKPNMDQHTRKPGSLGSEMRMRVKEHTRTMSNRTKVNYNRACSAFDAFRKEIGLSNSAVRENPRNAVELWRDRPHHPANKRTATDSNQDY